MSRNIVLLVLVAYPFVHLLPLNLIRFQWGFKRGLAPMPLEVETRAEAADRVALFFFHLMLLVLVVLSMRSSPISVHEAGLTVDNWKLALGIGAMFSLLPLGLSQLLLSNVPPEVARKEAESRGPVATWCGLVVLGSFSHGLWSAFCIVALIRLGFSAWLAVVITALFFAAVSLQVSIPRALGAAAFGGAAGFLFVYTGSLLAPLAMGIIGGLSNLYYVRQACSAVRPQFSYYSKPCPICGEVIRLTKVRWAGDMITCPNCGECLTTKKKYLWAIGAVSILLAAYATRQFVHRDPDWVFIAEGVALVLFLVLAFCFSLMVPPGLKRVRGKAFDKALSLFGTDRSDNDKKQVHK